MANRRLAALLLGAILTACSRRAAPGGETEGGARARDSMPGMSDMTGMAMGSDSTRRTGEVVLTAAQIEHGGIRWAPATAGTAASATATNAAIPGQLGPNEDRTARLGATAAGQVLTVRVSQGDRVHAGQVLVTLRSPEAGVAQSDLVKATAAVSSQRAQAAYAASARQRAERLLALKAIPRQDYERAIADDELARAELAQAEAELNRAQSTANALGATGAASGELAIRTPLAGVVLERTATPGSVVSAGTPLVTITDPMSLWLTLNAPESAAGSLRIGQPLRFTVPAYPTDTFTARLTAVGAGLDPDTRTLFARAVLVNRGGRLKPAMLANVLLPAPQQPVVGAGTGSTELVLPADAVQLLDSVTVAFVVAPGQGGAARFTARPVETGPRSGNQVVILRGLNQGELVVVTGAFAVKAELKKAGIMKMEM